MGRARGGSLAAPPLWRQRQRGAATFDPSPGQELQAVDTSTDRHHGQERKQVLRPLPEGAAAWEGLLAFPWRETHAGYCGPPRFHSLIHFHSILFPSPVPSTFLCPEIPGKEDKGQPECRPSSMSVSTLVCLQTCPQELGSPQPQSHGVRVSLVTGLSGSK